MANTAARAPVATYHGSNEAHHGSIIKIMMCTCRGCRFKYGEYVVGNRAHMPVERFTLVTVKGGVVLHVRPESFTQT